MNVVGSDGFANFDVGETVAIVEGFLEQCMQSQSDLAGIAASINAFRTEHLESLHPFDIASVYSNLTAEIRSHFFEVFGLVGEGEFISYLADSLRLEVLEILENDELAEVLAHLESDDAVDLVEDLSFMDRERLLNRLSRQERIKLETQIRYPEDTVGRLMRFETVSVPEYWNVGQTIDYMRATTDRLPDLFYTVVVVDAEHRPLGNATLSHVLRSNRSVSIRSLLDERDTVFSAMTDREDLARSFRQYGLVEISVVGENGRLIGGVTVDDVIEVLHEENEEDARKQVGVGDIDVYTGFWQASFDRIPWLMINLVTAVLASMVIGLFSETIESMVALAVMMPIVVSMGGNGGLQTLGIVMRGLATGEIMTPNLWRVLRREFFVSIVNGVICGLCTSLIGYIWFRNELIFIVVFFSVVLTLVIGVLSGMLLPILLEKMRIDPAVSSTIVLTTVTDVVGFFSILGLASLLLDWF